MNTDSRRRRALAGFLAGLRARAANRVLLEQAEIELWGVWRREQAALLDRAAHLARCFDADEGSPGAPPDLAAWRRAARECAAYCDADGYPVAPVLRRCLSQPIPDWPHARVLARAAARRRPVTR